MLCYGLRTDFRGEPFEGSKYLLAWAEELVEIKTVCFTGKKATMNARVDASGNQLSEGEQVQIGHHYISLSRKEFGLDRVSPIGYTAPEAAAGEESRVVFGEPNDGHVPKPNTVPPKDETVTQILSDAEDGLGELPTAVLEP